MTARGSGAGAAAGLAATCLLAAATIVPIAGPARAQEPELRGRVLLGADSVALGRVEVALHVVGADSAGVVRRDTADADGRFRFRIPPADSSTLFLVTVRHQGVVYFGTPFHGSSSAPDPYRVVAYPTRPVDRAAALPIARRHLVVEPAAGGLDVMDMTQVANDSAWTWTAGEGDGPVWSVGFPSSASGVSVAAGGVEGREVELAGGRALVRAAVPPGGGRLVLRYRLPAGREVGLPVERPVRSLDLMVGEGAEATVGGLEAREAVTVQGERYRRYGARDLSPGSTIRFSVSADATSGDGPSGGSGGRLLPWILAGLGLALLAAAAWIRRRLRAGGAGG